MNTKNAFRCLSAMAIILMAVIFTGCKEDEPGLATNDSQDVNSEAVSDSYFEDTEDLSSTVALTDDNDFGGRAEGLKGRDDRFACAIITIKNKAEDVEAGDTIIVDFGTGCTDLRGNVRKGKIVIYYTGNRNTLESQIVTKFDGFYVNGIKFEGTRTVSVNEISNLYIVHEISLENGKITWPDGSFAERDAHHFRKWFHNGTFANRIDDVVTILAEDGWAEGSNRNEREYVMDITEDIVFKGSCFSVNKFLPVSGEKVLLVGDREITVNYGEGDCDNTISVTIGGVTREVTVNR